MLPSKAPRSTNDFRVASTQHFFSKLLSVFFHATQAIKSLALTRLALALSLTFILNVTLIPRAAAANDLVVMTYNILNSNSDFASIADVIRSSDADLVLTQEVTEDAEPYLTDHLADSYPSISIHPATPSRLGLGVFSRYPLLVDDFSAYQADSSRLRLQIEVGDTKVTIYNVHLVNPLSNHNAGAQAHVDAIHALLDMLADEHGPLIVAGDFNMTDFSGDYRLMATTLSDSFRESGSGLGFTYPAWSVFPLARLDYVFHSDDLHSLEAQVGSASGKSDHFPVMVKLTLSGN